jgi:hypothetical protein
MLPSIRLMRHVLGLGFSALLMVGCQDMLGENQRQSTDQDLQLNAQQGVADEKAVATDTVAVCKELYAQLNSPEIQAHTDLYLQAKNRFGEWNCFAVAGAVEPTTPPKEPNMEEVCHNLKTTLGTMGTDNPKYPYYLADYQKLCTESKVTMDLPSCDPKATDLPLSTEPAKPIEEPKKVAEPPVLVDTLALCKELDIQLKSEAVKKETELYMAVKQKHIALNCFQVIGDATPAIPPKEPTQEENCVTIKNLIATVGSDNPKYSYYIELYQANCAEAEPQDAPISTEPTKPVEPPRVTEEKPKSPDNVGVCKELYVKLNTQAVFENVDLYMQIKNQFGELNCFALIGNPQPTTPPKVLTQEEVCANIKSTMELLTTLGNEPTKLETYKIEYQANCVAH